MRGSPHRVGFWGRDGMQADGHAIRFPFNPVARCFMCLAAGKPSVPIYLYIEMHRSRPARCCSYIYIYRIASLGRGSTYVTARVPLRTNVNVTYEAGHSLNQAPARPFVRNEGASEALPPPAPKTKAASARSAETVRASGAHPYRNHRHQKTKRGVLVTPPSSVTWRIEA